MVIHLIQFICLPAVEIVPGKKTSKKILKKTNDFYKSISMNPINVKKELTRISSLIDYKKLYGEKGFILLNEGYATTKDLDRAIEDGPGLRWSLMGTFLTFHLAGGKSGMKHMLGTIWTSLKTSMDKTKSSKLIK